MSDNKQVIKLVSDTSRLFSGPKRLIGSYLDTKDHQSLLATNKDWQTAMMQPDSWTRHPVITNACMFVYGPTTSPLFHNPRIQTLKIKGRPKDHDHNDLGRTTTRPFHPQWPNGVLQVQMQTALFKSPCFVELQVDCPATCTCFAVRRECPRVWLQGSVGGLPHPATDRRLVWNTRRPLTDGRCAVGYPSKNPWKSLVLINTQAAMEQVHQTGKGWHPASVTGFSKKVSKRSGSLESVAILLIGSYRLQSSTWRWRSPVTSSCARHRVCGS